jgi:hypothetical protein
VGGGGGEERDKRMSTEQILCTHVCKCKMILIETVPGMQGRQIKERDGGDEFKYNVFDAL